MKSARPKVSARSLRAADALVRAATRCATPASTRSWSSSTSRARRADRCVRRAHGVRAVRTARHRARGADRARRRSNRGRRPDRRRQRRYAAGLAGDLRRNVGSLDAADAGGAAMALVTVGMPLPSSFGRIVRRGAHGRAHRRSARRDAGRTRDRRDERRHLRVSTKRALRDAIAHLKRRQRAGRVLPHRHGRAFFAARASACCPFRAIDHAARARHQRPRRTRARATRS